MNTISAPEGDSVISQVLAAYELPGTILDIARHGKGHINDTFCVSCRTCLISAPPDIGAEIIKNNCAGLIPVDEFKIAGKIIVLLFAVFSLPAGVIKPYVKNLAVLREQFRQLIAEVIVVFRCAVTGTVSVPGG